MIRRALICCITFGLVACATQPHAPVTPSSTASTPVKPATGPAEAVPEKKQDLPPVDLTPVPFETARANFVRDTAARYGIDPAYIEATLAQAQIREPIIAAMSRPAERVGPLRHRSRSYRSHTGAGADPRADHRGDVAPGRAGQAVE
ncbi:hypothetical protein D3C81_1676510 [compost metagenome]